MAKERVSNKGLSPAWALVWVMAVAAVYWLWFGLTQRSIIGDDGISILAAEGILKNGYPLLPSGYLYHRAYLSHYLLAASIGLFGWNDLGIMMSSFLMALGCLWVVYLFARDLFGRPWVGVAAAALMVTLQAVTFYAASPRMYMALQWFALLASYAAWRGYVKGEKRFQWITGLAIAGAISSHQEGGGVLVAVPVAVFLARRISQAKAPSIDRLKTVVGMAALLAFFTFRRSSSRR